MQRDTGLKVRKHPHDCKCTEVDHLSIDPLCQRPRIFPRHFVFAFSFFSRYSSVNVDFERNWGVGE